MQQIEKLNWDTDFFNAGIGKASVYDVAKFDAKAFYDEARRNFDIVYLFGFETMLDASVILDAHLELVDIMITMSKPFDKLLYRENNYELRNQLSEAEKADCYLIAEQTSVVSRFHNESFAGPEKTRALYRKWIDNALEKQFSDGMFLSSEDNRVNGIHLIKTDNANKTGYFTMTGVNTNLKRSGIGRKLWEQSYGFFANETDIDTIKSPFSFRNKDSFNFHLKMGFNKIEEVKYVYHFRNNDTIQ